MSRLPETDDGAFDDRRPVGNEEVSDVIQRVADLFSAIKRNPSVLAAMRRPKSVREAADALLASVAKELGI